jgi:hypothetical protein
VGYQILRAVVGEGQTIRHVAQFSGLTFGLEGRRAEGYVGGRIVEALDVLVALWGMTGQGRKYKARSEHKLASHETTTGPQVEFVVGRFGELVPAEKAPQEVRNRDKKSSEKS